MILAINIYLKYSVLLNANCKRQIFTERFTGFLNAYRRLTVRLEEVFFQLSLSVSAEAYHASFLNMDMKEVEICYNMLFLFKSRDRIINCIVFYWEDLM